MKNSLLPRLFIVFLLGLFTQFNINASGTNTGLLASHADRLDPCDIPTGLYVNNITDYSATLHWSPADGAQSYSVQIRLPNGSWSYVAGSPFMSTFAHVDDLNPGTTYEWRVRSNCSFGYYSNWSYPDSFTTDGSFNCNAPSWLTTLNITQTSATFDWSSVSGAQSYSIQWRYPGGTWYTLGGGPFYNSWVNVGGLEPDTDYEWRVKSNCSNGMMSDWSYAASFTTLGNSCDIPGGLYTSDITQTSATLHWSHVPEAHSYSVQYRLPGGTWYFVQGSPFDENSVTLDGLNPGTTYEWRVRANCGYGYSSSWSYPISFTTEGSFSCDAPSYLNTLNITQTTATLDWSAVSGAHSYSIQWRYAGGTWHNLAGGPWTNTILTIGGLQPGTAYEWRVRSNCSNYQTSEWSYPEAFTTLPASCSVPEELFTSNITETSATFHWSDVAGANSYSVQIRLPNGIWQYIYGSPFSGNSATVHGLTPGTTYQWRVRANCGYGHYSDWSYPETFTTEGSFSCDAPDYLATLNITQTTATFDWDPASGAISYSVQWRYPGGTWFNLAGGPWTHTSITVGGLQPGTTYEWRVRSNCANGTTSEWSDPASFTTLPSSCLVPSELYTSNITNNGATFNWDAVPGAITYSVQIRQPNGVWTFIPGSPFTNTFASVSGLAPGTAYEWRVRSNCGYGHHSSWSAAITFSTGGSFNCNPPSYLSELNITQTTVSLDWSNVTGATGYEVEWRIAGDIEWTTLDGSPFTNSWATMGGLQPGTTYEWRVRTICSNGMTSEWSVIETFTTLSTSCDTPVELFTSNVTEHSATFNWDAVPGAQNYSLQTRLPGGTWYFAPGSPYYSTSVTIDGFDPGTTYEWRVRANCGSGNQSLWSPAETFTTEGSNTGNDFCSNAIHLTVNDDCQAMTASTIDATPSSPPPFGYCSSSGYKDIWFKFQMPNVSNPKATVRTTAGSLTDAVMELYTGSSCSYLSYLGCEDDNNNGNGSDMPVVSLSGGPGHTVWVRIWGKNGAEGTFDICVFDYVSSNFAEEGIPVISLDGESIEPIIAGENDDKVIEPIFTVSPNPATDILQIRYSQTDESKITGLMITDLSGKVMVRESFERSEENKFERLLDVSTYSPGMYLVQIITTTGVVTKKISVVD